MDFSNYFKAHIDNAPPTEDEYIKDGLKYCKKCNKQKQCIIEYQGEKIKVSCVCDCMDEQMEAQEREKKRLIANELKRGIRDKLYLDMTFDKSDEELKVARNYVNKFDKFYKDNVGLMLIGDKGTGKTFMAGCIANELCERGHSVYMSNVLEITRQLSDFHTKEATMDNIKRCELLIIDDVGAENQSDYMCANLYDVVDARRRANKPIIITSNLTMEQLNQNNDIRLERTYDRLIEMCHPIVMKGKSRRVKKANERFKNVKRELEEE